MRKRSRGGGAHGEVFLRAENLITMQIRLFLQSIESDASDLEEMNQFLRRVKVVDIAKHIVNIGDALCWSFCVVYLNDVKSDSQKRTERVDYREILSAEEFAVFAKMREVRKNISQADGVPIYAIFTNEELSEMAKLSVSEPLSLSKMKKVNGIGEKKLEKYGERFITGLASSFDNTTNDNKQMREDETDRLPF